MDLPDKTAAPQPTKQVKRIVPAGAAKSASRPASRRFFDFVFAGSPKELAKRTVENVVVPRAKAAVEEAFNSFVHGMFWGGGSSPASQIMQGTVLRGGGVNYNAISNNPQTLAAAASPSPAGPYQDLIVPTQEYAEALLAHMFDLHNQYRVVAVADLYEAAQMTPDIQLNGLGWYSLDGSKITKERDGYRLSLPRPQKI
jgi:hypothetical protein